VKELDSYKGRHTELVSVYIPAGYQVSDVINQLINEKSTASNIKSKTTRKNVLTALEKIIQHLKLLKQTPENGFVVFSGNVSLVEGKEDIRIWSFEPPVKMNQKMYWCDQKFVLEPLKDLVREKEVYGLVVLDAKEAYIGLLKGKTLEVVKHEDSTVPSKSVKGGMSQRRYDRIREDALNEFFSKVAELASKVFLQEKNLKGVIIGGPGPLKEQFYKGNYLHYEIQNKVLGVKDTSYTDEAGLEELVHRSEDLMKESALVKEREILKQFFTELQKDEKITYGLKETEKALEMGAVDTLLISEDFDWVRGKFICQNGHEFEKDVKKDLEVKCPKCHVPAKLDQVKDLNEYFVERAKLLGTKVEIISTQTGEGKQFKELGGIGAFLRYRI